MNGFENAFVHEGHESRDRVFGCVRGGCVAKAVLHLAELDEAVAIAVGRLFNEIDQVSMDSHHEKVKIVRVLEINERSYVSMAASPRRRLPSGTESVEVDDG